MEGYKFTAQSSSDALLHSVELAKKHNTKVSVTFSDIFIIEHFKENLQKVVKNSDLVFCNENESKCYTGASTAEEALLLLSQECPNVVITLGADGSLIHYEGQTYRVPAFTAKPIDTTGAGDCYAGAFLYGIIETNNPIAAGKLASAIGAKVVSQLGARISGDLTVVRNTIFSEFK